MSVVDLINYELMIMILKLIHIHGFAFFVLDSGTFNQKHETSISYKFGLCGRFGSRRH